MRSLGRGPAVDLCPRTWSLAHWSPQRRQTPLPTWGLGTVFSES